MSNQTFVLTGYVDSTAIQYEYGETAEPLLVYSTIEDLAKAHPCIAAGDDCYPVEVTITVRQKAPSHET